MVEMTAVSNATGLVPDVPGMHGPRIDVADLTKVFVPAEDGGILSKRGCVDYSTGRVAPGVFAIVTTSEPRVRTDMRFLGMGDGPYYLLYRPYHLCNIETPHAVAEAVLYGERTVVAKRLVSEVVAVAKRDLKAGEIAGDIGGPEFYNRIYPAEDAHRLRAIPMGLATGGRVTRDIGKGQVITADAFQPDAARFVYQLRQMQVAMLAAERGGEGSKGA
jgi:predicted homoserine dehydrogenase-like protein